MPLRCVFYICHKVVCGKKSTFQEFDKFQCCTYQPLRCLFVWILLSKWCIHFFVPQSLKFLFHQILLSYQLGLVYIACIYPCTSFHQVTLSNNFSELGYVRRMQQMSIQICSIFLYTSVHTPLSISLQSLLEQFVPLKVVFPSIARFSF